LFYSPGLFSCYTLSFWQACSGYDGLFIKTLSAPGISSLKKETNKGFLHFINSSAMQVGKGFDNFADAIFIPWFTDFCDRLQKRKQYDDRISA
jgi:hypothetical protein